MNVRNHIPTYPPFTCNIFDIHFYFDEHILQVKSCSWFMRDLFTSFKVFVSRTCNICLVPSRPVCGRHVRVVNLFCCVSVLQHLTLHVIIYALFLPDCLQLIWELFTTFDVFGSPTAVLTLHLPCICYMYQFLLDPCSQHVKPQSCLLLFRHLSILLQFYPPFTLHIIYVSVHSWNVKPNWHVKP